MASLFDSDDSSSNSEKPNARIFHDDISDDDATTFTVATVLGKRGMASDRSRRDTITRTMPTISIHDKSDIPTMVEMKQPAHQQPEERRQLRITSSLMDDSSDSDHDDGDDLREKSHIDIHGIDSKNSYREEIFRTPSHRESNVSATKSTILRRNTSVLGASGNTNLLDMEVVKVAGIDTSPNEAKQTNRRQSTDTFMSMYEDFGSKARTPSIKQTRSLDYGFAAKGTRVKTRVSTAWKSVAGGLAAHASSKQRTPSAEQTKSLDYDFAAKGTQVKTRVSTAFKSVAGGLAAHAASNSCDGGGSWDVEQVQTLSGKKRGIDIDEQSENYHRQRNRRKSFSNSEELGLMQNMMHIKTEECDSLKRKLEEYESQIQALQTENSIVIQSKVILESKLDIAKEARQEAETNASAAQAEADSSEARAESLSCQLKDSQSEMEGLKLDLEVERQKNHATAKAVGSVMERLQAAEYQLKKVKRQKKDEERERESVKSRAELQDEIDKMRSALKGIKELENVRLEKTQRIEAELNLARLATNEAELSAASLRGAMEELKKENGSLHAQLKQSKTRVTSNLEEWKMEWEEGTEGIEIAAVMDQQMNDIATPNISNPRRINALGATYDTKDAKSSDRVSKVPLKAIFPGTPDSSTRQLSFASSTLFSPGKENNQNNMNARHQSECSLCFRPPRRNGVIRRCQCGSNKCNKWAHATCLVNMKSVSTSVSHPGTPAPPLPTILCSGPWDEN